MALQAFNVNGMLRSKLRSNAAKRLGLMLSALSLMTLTGCATRTTATDLKAQCAAWRAIKYSSKGDTKPTVQQVRVHNATGRNLGCW